jgi:hypothetical protein
MSNLKRYCFKPKTYCQLFDAFVGSILNYSCEVWGFTKSKQLETLHLKFCKRLLGVKQSTCNMGVYGELGRYPLYITRHCRIIKYWCKLVNTENVIMRKIYRLMMDDLNDGRVNWLSNVKTLLGDCGYSFIWHDQCELNLKDFHLSFKRRLIDIFIQSWYASLNASKSLCTYRFFKDSFDTSFYLSVLPKKYRQSLSRLRLSSHCLRVETERYNANRLDRNERHCVFCDKPDIEDEYHFVLVCSLYVDLRKKYIGNYYYKRPSVYKFVELMSSNKAVEILKLSKYVFEAFDIRKDALHHIT